MFGLNKGAVTSYIMQSGGPMYAGFGMAVIHRILNYTIGVTAMIPVAVTTAGVGGVYADVSGQDVLGGAIKGFAGGVGGDMAVSLVV